MSDVDDRVASGDAEPERERAYPPAPQQDMEEPPARFWGRVMLVVPSVLLAVISIVVLSFQGLGEPLPLDSSLLLCCMLAALSAGFSLYLHWLLTGEATFAWLAAALTTVALAPLPAFLLDFSADPLHASDHLGPTTRLVTAVPAAWLVLRAMRAHHTDRPLHPMRTGLVFGAVACAVAVAVRFGQTHSLLPVATPVQTNIVDCLLSLVAFSLAAAFAVRNSPMRRSVRIRIALVIAGLGLSAALTALARAVWPPLEPVGPALTLAALLVMALLAHSLLQSAIDGNDLRLLALSLRAESAEHAMRREQERLHELRTTVAGIRHASGTLREESGTLDPQHKHRLERMMAAELVRLERLLAGPLTHGVGGVLLDEVIRPLAVAQQERGADLHWRPSGVRVLGRPDDLAQIVHCLLDNARRHAPLARVDLLVDATESLVRVTVRDDGPGVPSGSAERIFERGVRSGASAGDGLGLHIARRLAYEQGGSLDLVPSSTQQGAGFVLTLRPASDPPVVPQQRNGHAGSR
jgi:signal transduction histidine kinase